MRLGAADHEADLSRKPAAVAFWRLPPSAARTLPPTAALQVEIGRQLGRGRRLV
jgi:hypothetical protein